MKETKEKPLSVNEKIELARQSGYNEACYIYGEKVARLKEFIDSQVPSKSIGIFNKEIDKIMGSFKGVEDET